MSAHKTNWLLNFTIDQKAYYLLAVYIAKLRIECCILFANTISGRLYNKNTTEAKNDMVHNHANSYEKINNEQEWELIKVEEGKHLLCVCVFFFYEKDRPQNKKYSSLKNLTAPLGKS